MEARLANGSTLPNVDRTLGRAVWPNLTFHNGYIV